MKTISLLPIKLILGSALFFCLTLFAVSKPKEKKRSDYIAPPLAIRNLTVGMKYVMADLLWLRALQDFDYCDQKINEVECRSKSWLFQTLDVATEIDPVFEAIRYRFAGLALTIVISDYAGASIIFDKAVAQHPRDWPLNYAAGYHALYEEKNKLKAAKLYEMAARHGAPAWVYSLAGRLRADEGDLEYTRQILQEMIETNQDELIINRLKKKIAEMEAQQSR